MKIIGKTLKIEIKHNHSLDYEFPKTMLYTLYLNIKINYSKNMIEIKITGNIST